MSGLALLSADNAWCMEVSDVICFVAVAQPPVAECGSAVPSRRVESPVEEYTYPECLAACTPGCLLMGISCSGAGIAAFCRHGIPVCRTVRHGTGAPHCL